MRHTPGPWEMEKAGASSTGSVHYAVKTAYKPEEHPWSPRFITFMCGGLGDYLPSRRPNEYRDDEQIEADVRLICAAPDLLEALIAITDQLERVGDNRKDAPFIEAARAAIAKAEGAHQLTQSRQDAATP